MTPRTLFIIILRVLGILCTKELLIAIPQLISTVLVFFRGYSISDGLFMIVISLLTVALIISIAYVLIFKADALVSKFGLVQGINEPMLTLNISIPSILRIALIVTGFMIIVSEIPQLGRIIFQLLQQNNMQYLPTGAIDWSPAVFSGINIIIGCLIIGERKRILQFLDRNAEKEVKEQS